MDQFSEEFASHWDEFVGWEKRSLNETSFLLGLIEKFKCKNVLDVALGTGFHSIELLKRGIHVKSTDISPAMIKAAHLNAARHAVALDVVCADWSDFSQKISGKFDCILCLGNSLACEMDYAKRQQAVCNWGQVLCDGGVVIVDRRNYEALLDHKYNFSSGSQYSGETVKIIPSIIKANETVFSYTFTDGNTFDLRMYPLQDRQINALFTNEGFRPIEVYGDQKRSQVGWDIGFYTHVFEKMQCLEG